MHKKLSGDQQGRVKEKPSQYINVKRTSSDELELRLHEQDLEKIFDGAPERQSHTLAAKFTQSLKGEADSNTPHDSDSEVLDESPSRLKGGA